MSDAGNIITAISADVSTAVSGVTISLLPVNPSDLRPDDLPHCTLLLVDYGVSPIDWGQEERTWSVYGLVSAQLDTREEMQLLLDAIRDQVFADPTLDASVDRATCAPLVPYSSHEEKIMLGEFSVLATKVV